jgi:subtilisin family serine protease
MSAFDNIRERIIDTYNFVDMNENVYQHNNHGTFVLSAIGAEIPNQICGTAPDASFALYISEEDGRETRREPDNYIAAIERADSIGADIITASLGYFDFDDGNNTLHSDLDGKTARNSRAATIAARKGIVVVNSAGNEALHDWHYIITPADADSILTVGSVTNEGLYSSFSSTGNTADGRIKPDICAQGTAAFLVNTNNEVFQGSGTSFSAPIAAGMVASLWSALPHLTNFQIMDEIRKSASQYEHPDSLLGYGIPNVWTIYQKLWTKIDVILENQTYFAKITDNNFLEISVSNSHSYKFSLFDILGRKIFENQAQGNSQFNIPSLSKGVYILIFEDKNKISTLKIINN